MTAGPDQRWSAALLHVLLSRMDTSIEHVTWKVNSMTNVFSWLRENKHIDI